MSRSLFLGVLSSLCVLALSITSSAAEPPREKVEAAHDLRPVLEKMRKNQKLIEGRNKIHSEPKAGEAPGFTLYAVVEKGHIKAWEAVGSDGKKYRTKLNEGGGKVTCTVCVERPGPNNTTIENCWEISCTDLPRPIGKAE